MKFLITLICGLFTVCIWHSSLSASETWKIKVRDKEITVEIAQSEKEQQLGLGNRFSLAEGYGMLFTYRKSGNRIFWMKRMYFAIDIIWLFQGKIVHIERNVPPPAPGTPDRDLKRYGMGILADMVLEVPAGYVQRNYVMVGDSVQIIDK